MKKHYEAIIDAYRRQQQSDTAIIQTMHTELIKLRQEYNSYIAKMNKEAFDESKNRRS